MRDRYGRWMEGKKRVVPGEICAERSERSNCHCKVALSAQKSAEVIVGIWTWKHGHDNRRTESIGVLSMTEKGGMTLNGRKH